MHQFVADKHLVDHGLTNYWGYNSIGFFAPMRAIASGDGVWGSRWSEFKTMVKTLHREGIEVILDVVYNHTAEGNHLGPTLCFRGIDNASYYRLLPRRRPALLHGLHRLRQHAQHDASARAALIMDSLRYWVLEMHVDGFRFDLASALARELHEVDRLGAFFDIIHQDPVLSQVKLIAEPWDLGEGGYQVGNFPVLLGGMERQSIATPCAASGRAMRDRSAASAYRLTGSSDLYDQSGRKPYASINFVTAHDGFTLHDLVSYNEKHNEANGEDNRDGTTTTSAGTAASKVPPTIPAIIELRAAPETQFSRHADSLAGRADALAGDEIGRTQQGNNNAYCQDNEISWLDWDWIRGGNRYWNSPEPDSSVSRTSGAAAPQVFSGAANSRLGGQGPDLVPARRQRNDR